VLAQMMAKAAEIMSKMPPAASISKNFAIEDFDWLFITFTWLQF
jgi:hypothetical protein